MENMKRNVRSLSFYLLFMSAPAFSDTLGALNCGDQFPGSGEIPSYKRVGCNRAIEVLRPTYEYNASRVATIGNYIPSEIKEKLIYITEFSDQQTFIDNRNYLNRTENSHVPSLVKSCANGYCDTFSTQLEHKAWNLPKAVELPFTGSFKTFLLITVGSNFGPYNGAPASIYWSDDYGNLKKQKLAELLPNGDARCTASTPDPRCAYGSYYSDNDTRFQITWRPFGPYGVAIGPGNNAGKLAPGLYSFDIGRSSLYTIVGK
jgi:hypothetical protein